MIHLIIFCIWWDNDICHYQQQQQKQPSMHVKILQQHTNMVIAITIVVMVVIVDIKKMHQLGGHDVQKLGNFLHFSISFFVWWINCIFFCFFWSVWILFYNDHDYIAIVSTTFFLLFVQNQTKNTIITVVYVYKCISV